MMMVPLTGESFNSISLKYLENRKLKFRYFVIICSDSSDTSEDSQYETSAILARRGIQLKGNTNGILDRFEDDGFNSR